MSSSTFVPATSPFEASPVVFSRDGTSKPRASWFNAASADLATKAADLMKMRVIRVETEEQKSLAHHLAR